MWGRIAGVEFFLPPPSPWLRVVGWPLGTASVMLVVSLDRAPDPSHGRDRVKNCLVGLLAVVALVAPAVARQELFKSDEAAGHNLGISVPISGDRAIGGLPGGRSRFNTSHQ